MVKGRLRFHLGRLGAEEDALTLKLEVLNMEDALKDHGLGCHNHHVVSHYLPRRGAQQKGTIIKKNHATSWASIHHVVVNIFPQKPNI